MSRAPSIKATDGTKDGHRAFTVTYHADGDDPQTQICADVYRDVAGAPTLDLRDHVKLASPAQAFYTLADVKVEAGQGASKGTYKVTVTAAWHGFTGVSACQTEAASAMDLRAKLVETGVFAEMMTDALATLHLRIDDVLAGAQAIAKVAAR